MFSLFLRRKTEKDIHVLQRTNSDETVKSSVAFIRLSHMPRTSPSVAQNIAAVITGFPQDASSNLIPLYEVARSVLVECHSGFLS